MYIAMRSKKAQLMALEIKLTLIGFLIGFGVALALLVILSLTGNLPGFVCNLLC